MVAMFLKARTGANQRASQFAENRTEFLEKLEKARSSVSSDSPQPILSQPSSNTVSVGNWCLISRKDGELRIINTDGQQVCTWPRSL